MEVIKKNETQKNFFSKKSGMVCTTQLQLGCTPAPLFFLWSSNERGENYAFSNEQIKKSTPYTIYIYVRAREGVRAKKAKTKKLPAPGYSFTLFFAKLNIIPFPAYILHIFPKFVQKPYKIPTFYQFCKVEFTK